MLILLAPVLMYASIRSIYNQNELNDPSKVSYINANVLAIQRFRGHLEARYEFQVAKGGPLFSATDSLGRKNLWEIISLHNWDNINSGSKTIRIKYLISNPSVNVPADGAGNHNADLVVGITFSAVMFVLGLYTISKTNKFLGLSRSKLTRHNASLMMPTHLTVGSGRGAQVQNDVQNEQNARFPATFVVCQIAGALTLFPVLAYIRGGALRERAVALLPYLAIRSWVWAELAVGILLLAVGGRALFTSARKRRSHRTVVH